MRSRVFFSTYLRDAFDKDFKLIKNFVSKDEENNLVATVSKRLRRLPYEDAHFDGVIRQYRETMISWDERTPDSIKLLSGKVFEILPKDRSYLPIHILDLNMNGYIAKHVDNIKGRTRKNLFLVFWRNCGSCQLAEFGQTEIS